MRILFSSPAPSLPVEPPETRFGILVMTAVEDGDARISRHASVAHGEVENVHLARRRWWRSRVTKCAPAIES